MAKIELAYSLEYQDVVDAIEANELWMEGVIKEKRAFICTGAGCDAGITCKNMDSYPETRKMIPHFIMSSRENEHYDLCEVLQELEKASKEKVEKEKGSKLKNISPKVCFHVERPEHHRKIVNTTSIEKKLKEELEEKKRKAIENRKCNNSNFYWLNSLIWYYIAAYKENRLNEEEIEIDFGNGRKYKYDLAYLFKRINQEKLDSEKRYHRYIYYGRAKIFSREDGGYDIVFYEKFTDSQKKVKSVISKDIIDRCEHGKNNKLAVLEQNKEEDRFVYILSSKNENDKCAFLNVMNLDCIAISKIDLDHLEEEEEQKD